MTKDDIIRMAKEAGFDKNSLGTTFTHGKLDENLLRFAALVAVAEREACAKVCEVGTGEPIQMKALEMLRQERERIAKAIRARGKE